MFKSYTLNHSQHFSNHYTFTRNNMVIVNKLNKNPQKGFYLAQDQDLGCFIFHVNKGKVSLSTNKQDDNLNKKLNNLIYNSNFEILGSVHLYEENNQVCLL